MTNLMRREDYNTPSLFRKGINDMFENFFGTGVLSPLSNLSLAQSGWATVVPIDVIDNGSEYRLKANLPGLEKKDVDIQLTDNVLTIRGSYEQSSEDKNNRYLLQERRSGSFSRSIAFHEEIVADKISACFKDGILEVTIPKAEQKQNQSIKIEIAD